MTVYDEVDENEVFDEDEVSFPKKDKGDQIKSLAENNRILRQENRRLRKEISRLEKQLQNREEYLRDAEERQLEEHQEQRIPLSAKEKKKAAKAEEDSYMEFVLPDGSIKKIKKRVSEKDEK